MKSTGGADRTLTLGPGEVRPFDGPLSTSGHGLGKVRAEVLSSVESDAAEVAVPVIPYGLREIDGASGVLHEEGFADLVLPENAVDGTVSLTVTLSPSVNVSLLESLAYTMSYPWGCVEQTANRFLPALAAREALESMGSWDTRRKEQLDRTVERGLSALYALQADDGSFGWFGPRRWGSGERASGGSPDNTAYALLAMLRAERAGYRVSVGNRDRAIEAARRLAQGASSEDRAFLLYALAHAGQADLAELNRLHRERETLSARALALLTLTMHRTGRPGNATEGAQILVSRANRSGGMASWDATPAAVKSLRGWPHPIVDVEPTAYALLALLATDETSPLIDEAAAWISANRRGPAWRSTRDTAAAIEALAAWAKTRSVARAECEVQVFVGGGAEPVGSARFGGGARPVDAPVSIDVPASALSAGKNRVVLRKKGSGAVH